MTMGRAGKIRWSNAARKGWAGVAMPGTDNAPPNSNRRARACTAGVCVTSASQSPLADAGTICAKREEGRSPRPARQGGGWRGRGSVRILGARNLFRESLERAGARGMNSALRQIDPLPMSSAYRAQLDALYFDKARRSLCGCFISRSYPRKPRACRRSWQIAGANQTRRSRSGVSGRHRRDARNPAAIPDSRDARSC